LTKAVTYQAVFTTEILTRSGCVETRSGYAQFLKQNFITSDFCTCASASASFYTYVTVTYYIYFFMCIPDLIQ